MEGKCVNESEFRGREVCSIIRINSSDSTRSAKVIAMLVGPALSDILQPDT